MKQFSHEYVPRVASPLVVYTHLSQQHEGLQHTVFEPQQEVTKPNERFKPTLQEKSDVDRGSGINQVAK